MNIETNRLLDRAAKKLPTPSDYSISKALGVSSAAVSKWRSGRNHMADTAALKLAEILGEPAGSILALVAADRTSDPAAKKQWTNMARTLKASAAAVSLITLGFTMFPDGQARSSDLSSSPGINVMLNYAMTADGSDSPPFLSYLVIHEAGSEPVSCDSWIRGQSGTLRAPLIVIEQISPA